MRFMLRVELTDESASYAVLSVRSDDRWEDRLVPRSSLTETVDGLGLALAGLGAYEALRVQDHRPRLGFETDHRTIPHELGWIGTAVHLDKGCYRGQETVARVHNLGRPPRRLVFGHLDGTADELPPPHTPVELDGRTIGFLGTAVQHAELGPIALAVIKRQTPDDAELTVAGMAMKSERVVDA
jgi:folate-binding protein YgfZ